MPDGPMWNTRQKTPIYLPLIYRKQRDFVDSGRKSFVSILRKSVGDFLLSRKEEINYSTF